MVSKTAFDTLPPYLKAVTVFRAKGNLAAEVVDCIEGLLAKGLLTPDDSSSRSAPGDLTETYHDAQVESVRTQLIQLLPQPGDEEIFLRNKVFPILRTLFVGWNTFEEKVAECRDEVWTR